MQKRDLLIERKTGFGELVVNKMEREDDDKKLGFRYVGLFFNIIYALVIGNFLGIHVLLMVAVNVLMWSKDLEYLVLIFIFFATLCRNIF